MDEVLLSDFVELGELSSQGTRVVFVAVVAIADCGLRLGLPAKTFELARSLQNCKHLDLTYIDLLLGRPFSTPSLASPTEAFWDFSVLFVLVFAASIFALFAPMPLNTS